MEQNPTAQQPGKQEIPTVKSFNKELIKIVIPIAIQNLISAAVMSADILIIGRINQDAMAAISLAQQFVFVLILFHMGLAVGAGILASQYWGKGDRNAIKKVMSISLAISTIISAVFFIASLVIPNLVMRVFTSDPTLIEYGVAYLPPLSITLLLMSVSNIYLTILKSMENTRLSALISTVSLLVNLGLNSIAVLVIFPHDPKKAVIAVALATGVARLMEVVWSLIHSKSSDGIPFSLPSKDETERQLRRDFFTYTTPVLGNFLVWGTAVAAMTAIMGQYDSVIMGPDNTDLVAANSIAAVVKNLAIVLCSGIGVGGSVLVGKYLGRGDLEMARIAGNRVSVYSFIFGLISGGILLALLPLVLTMVNLTQGAEKLFIQMIFVSAVYNVGKAVNGTIIGGIFPAGGDSKFGFFIDLVVMWVITVPLSWLSAFVWKIPPFWLYVVINMDEFVKMAPAILRYRQYKWIKNLTREFAEDESVSRGESMAVGEKAMESV